MLPLTGHTLLEGPRTIFVEINEMPYKDEPVTSLEGTSMKGPESHARERMSFAVSDYIVITASSMVTSSVMTSS